MKEDSTLIFWNKPNRLLGEFFKKIFFQKQVAKCCNYVYGFRILNLSTLFQALKTFSIFSLAACLLLLSIGARSIVFHQWFHGDDVHCALVFEAGHEHHDQGHSEEDQRVGEDPLSPFCESGSLDLTYSSAFLFLAPCIEVMPTFLHDAPELTWTRSASPRAPPAWV